MSNEENWVRDKKRKITIGKKEHDSLLQSSSRTFSSDDPIEVFTQYFDEINDSFNPDSRVEEYEKWAKGLLKKNGLPTDIFTTAFNEAFTALAPEKFSEPNLARDALIQIRWLRDDGLDVKKAVVAALNLAGIYNHYIVSKLEKNALTGFLVLNSNKVPSNEVERWKQEATQFYEGRKRKPIKTEIYRHVAETVNKPYKTVAEKLKVHANKLVS